MPAQLLLLFSTGITYCTNRCIITMTFLATMESNTTLNNKIATTVSGSRDGIGLSTDFCAASVHQTPSQLPTSVTCPSDTKTTVSSLSNIARTLPTTATSTTVVVSSILIPVILSEKNPNKLEEHCTKLFENHYPVLCRLQPLLSAQTTVEGKIKQLCETIKSLHQQVKDIGNRFFNAFVLTTLPEELCHKMGNDAVIETDSKAVWKKLHAKFPSYEEFTQAVFKYFILPLRHPSGWMQDAKSHFETEVLRMSIQTAEAGNKDFFEKITVYYITQALTHKLNRYLEIFAKRFYITLPKSNNSKTTVLSHELITVDPAKK